jgi:cell division protein FtsQ
MKRILNISLWVIFAATLIIVMSFAGRSHGRRLCSRPEISIERKSGDLFIEEEDVMQLLAEHHMSPEGMELAVVDIPALERLLLGHPAVEACDVFMTVGGEMSIHLSQRRPLARFITLANESYYIDDAGKLMPWSEKYTAPVVLVNGDFTDTYASMYTKPFETVPLDTAQRSPTKLDDAWHLVKRIDADTFLRAQIVQVYVSRERGFTLIPRVGNHCIVLGDISDLDEKLRKLLVFYREGLERTGSWNDYTIIDLQYKNQIVCTKKEQ